MTAGKGGAKKAPGDEHVAITLNPEQQVVVSAPVDDWLLVVAGPGTGKTQVAAMRLLHLLRQGLNPAQILVLSFSRSAVATLTRRLSKVDAGEANLLEDLRHLAIRTFDAWAFRMLRQGGSPVSGLLARSHDDNIAAVTEALAREEDAIGERLRSIRHVIVDEFQDLPGVRADMVRALFRRLNGHGREPVGFTVLGDPAQAIFRFAARNAGNPPPGDPWMQLKADMGERLREIVLVRNHRSVPRLADMAQALRKILGSEALDARKKLQAMERLLSRIPATEGEGKLDAGWLDELRDGSLAILTRTNGEALGVWKSLCGNSLERPDVPVKVRLPGEVPGAPVWVAALFSAYRFPSITREVFGKACQRLEKQLGSGACVQLGLPPEAVAWKRLARAAGASETSNSLDLEHLRQRLDWPDSFPEDQVREDAAVYITTIHQAKGMEFENVALLEPTRERKAEEPEDPLEEANVGFVAVTRAGRELRRLPSDCIYTPPHPKRFQGGRTRQMQWGKMVSVQMGLPGDVEPCSFVDIDVHGDAPGVKSLQENLLLHSTEWPGHRVVLEKVSRLTGAEGKPTVHYDIRLQATEGAGLLLGRTSQQLTRDLLELLWKPGYQLPRTIYNLRIAEVVSCGWPGELAESVPEPWRSARLWLGVTLTGTGDFKTWRRNEG